VTTNDVILTTLLIILYFGSGVGYQQFISVHFITQKVHGFEGTLWFLQKYLCVLVLV
jgi:hypothetical protein